jgi:hypothetical protein
MLFPKKLLVDFIVAEFLEGYSTILTIPNDLEKYI